MQVHVVPEDVQHSLSPGLSQALVFVHPGAEEIFVLEEVRCGEALPGDIMENLLADGPGHGHHPVWHHAATSIAAEMLTHYTLGAKTTPHREGRRRHETAHAPHLLKAPTCTAGLSRPPGKNSSNFF